MMETAVLSLLVAGTIAVFAVYFVAVPAFVFLLCVRKKSGKWYIKKGAVLRFLLFFSKDDVPKNICYLHADTVIAAILASITLFMFSLLSFFFCGMVYVIVPAIIEHPKTFLALLLSVQLIAVITWKARAYMKTEIWQRKKKIKSQINKFSQAFQKAGHKVSNKICIKLENV